MPRTRIHGVAQPRRKTWIGHYGGPRRVNRTRAHSRIKLQATPAPTACACTTVGLISFDLDDTLFPCSAVVTSANSAMIDAMQAAGADAADASAFIAQTRRIRKTLDAPVTYANLRKRTIAAELQRLRSARDDTNNIHCNSRIVEHIYGVWLAERHAAAQRLLYPDALAMLDDVRACFPDACVAAITNGAGSPTAMHETLAAYFDFCVSGEDEDVFPHRKPHRRIYERAISRYRELYPHHHQQRVEGQGQPPKAWFHVGDCLANDVGGSADCGAYTVWLQPEPDASLTAAGDSAGYSTATGTEQESRNRLAMAARSQVDIRISSLRELRVAIENYLQPMDA